MTQYRTNKYLQWKDYLSRYSAISLSFKPYYLNFQRLYRVRVIEDEEIDRALDTFSNIQQIWNPPAKRTLQGRCNIKGQSILYLGNKKKSLPFEVGAAPGQLLCCGEFEHITPGQEIGPIRTAGYPFLKDFIELKEVLKNYPAGLNEENLAIDSRFSKIFAMPRIENGFNIHNLTNALTSIYFDKGKSAPIGIEKPKPIQGIIYPSVQMKFKAFNLAIKPKHARKHFLVKRLTILRFIKTLDDGSSLFKEKFNGRISYGKVTWTKSPANLQVHQ